MSSSDEVAALAAILGDDFDASKMQATLRSDNGELIVRFSLPAGYPRAAAVAIVSSSSGVSNRSLERVRAALTSKAKELARTGEAAMYEMCEVARGVLVRVDDEVDAASTANDDDDVVNKDSGGGGNDDVDDDVDDAIVKSVATYEYTSWRDWNADEQRRFEDALSMSLWRALGVDKRWQRIAEHVRTRSPGACVARYRVCCLTVSRS